MNWLITGVGSGLGEAVAKAALARGDRVCGIVRRQEAALRFEALRPGLATAFLADVTDREAVFAAVQAAQDAMSGVDVLVNNAGNVVESYIEEADPQAARALFECNVIGPLNAIQAVLPGMRARRHGRILNISSGGGIMGVPWVGIYSATKFALEGLSEALAKEVEALGIAVTIVEPGAFRTNLLARDHVRSASAITDYETSAGAWRARLSTMGGTEPGDPEKFAHAFLALVDSKSPPVRAALGDDAIAMALGKAESIRSDVEAWREIGSGLAFDDLSA